VSAITEADGGLSLALRGDAVAGVLRIHPNGDALRFTIEIEAGDPYDLVRIDLPLPPPPAATLHIPTGYTFGHAVDYRSPIGSEAGIELRGRRWQFCAAEIAGRALSFIGYSTLERIPKRSFGTPWRVGGYRDQDALWLQIECLTGTAWELADDDNLEGAIARYHAHLIDDYGAVPWRLRPSGGDRGGCAPDWFEQIKMVVTLDMYRSNSEIAHNYAHVRDLCREMTAAGVGGGVLFYLPGHHDRYDAGFPFYGPCDALGGEAGFREMVAAIHDAGHWVMPHVCIWGADPYQHYFEEIEELAVPWSEDEAIPNGRLGPYAAWPGPMPVEFSDFDSGWCPIEPEIEGNDGKQALFETVAVPRAMEAFLSISGLKGYDQGRMQVSLHDRILQAPSGALADGSAYSFQFRLRFEQGVNRVQLTFQGAAPDLSAARYRISDGIHPPDGNSLTRASVWTHPFVRMDITHPRWIEIVRDQLVALIDGYQVDGIHLDAAVIDTRGLLPIYQTLSEALPNTLFGCEYLAELNYSLYHITQNGSIPEPGPHRTTDLSHRLLAPFMKVYYHLCAADAFVPVATVCDHRPVPDDLPDWRRERVERLWREGPDWNITPNIRLNYRDYGLDPRTAQAFIQVLGKRAR
jgi:hypothetical protein